METFYEFLIHEMVQAQNCGLLRHRDATLFEVAARVVLDQMACLVRHANGRWGGAGAYRRVDVGQRGSQN
jgi:hypothetical protein